MDIGDNLNGVLTNLTNNLGQVQTQLDSANKAVSQIDDASLASIKQLLDKWEHPQSIAQFIQSVVQQEGLTKAKAEISTAIACIQAAQADEGFLAQAQDQLTANIAAAASPLPATGQSGAPAPADSATAPAASPDAAPSN